MAASCDAVGFCLIFSQRTPLAAGSRCSHRCYRPTVDATAMSHSRDPTKAQCSSPCHSATLTAISDEACSSSPTIQIYPEKTTLVSAFWREKYENDSRKYWDIFFKRNTNRFFKDRHYLDKEWDQYFQGRGSDADPSNPDKGSGALEQILAILEVGCGAGNTIFPLAAKYPRAFIYACDFSPRAVDIVKAHEDYDESRIKVFLSDVTSDLLLEEIQQASVDVITLVFVLSTISPEKMPAVIRNLKSILKPGGCVLLRDYAVGDLAQERFAVKNQQISENFYARGDGTRAYYFSEGLLRSLFVKEGFACKELEVRCRQLQNRSRRVFMDRRWIQGVFTLSEQSLQSSKELDSSKVSADPARGLPSCIRVTPVPKSPTHGTALTKDRLIDGGSGEPAVWKESEFCAVPDKSIIDLATAKLFEPALRPEPLEIRVGRHMVHAECLSGENQHTYAATGFMLWESASAFAELLAENSAVSAGKAVLELGCGSVGLCSLMSSLGAREVFATDGDGGALGLLQHNLNLNREAFVLDRISCHELKWGDKHDIDSVRAAYAGQGFQLIIGTDVTYAHEAIPLLFDTARQLLAEPTEMGSEPLLILCYRIRRVAEFDIISAANSHGFYVAGLWSSESSVSSENKKVKCSKRAFVKSVFKHGLDDVCAKYSALRILCLCHAKIK